MHTPRFGLPIFASTPVSALYSFASSGSPAHQCPSTLSDDPQSRSRAHIDNTGSIGSISGSSNINNPNTDRNNMSTLTTTATTTTAATTSVMMVNSAGQSGSSATLELGFAGTPSAGTGTAAATGFGHAHGFAGSVGTRPDAVRGECGSGNGAENAGSEGVGLRAWRFGRSAGEVELEVSIPSPLHFVQRPLHLPL